MAFYPDELSPIDRICVGGNSNDLFDINPLKNRRQWKSFVLGKKDIVLNNFATIAEEKEDEISNEEIPEILPKNKNEVEIFNANSEVTRNKKITFAKPKKYISSRAPDRKQYADLKELDNENPFPFRHDFFMENSVSSGTTKNAQSSPNVLIGATAGANELSLTERVKQPSKSKPLPDSVVSREDGTKNHPSPRDSSDWPWDKLTSVMPRTPSFNASAWQKRRPESDCPVPQDKTKSKSPHIVTLKSVNSSNNPTKRNEKPKKGTKKENKSYAPNSTTVNSFQTADKFQKGNPNNKFKKKSEKNKCLNMKDVVNVYKNLAYGSEQEIKSFVEKLSFVENDAKSERSRNLLSVMNLKALETKIKSFAKSNGQFIQKSSGSRERKSGEEKKVKKKKKTGLEKLVIQKKVKVPAAPRIAPSQNKKSEDSGSGRRNSNAQKEGKAPWKYVGMQSILDKMYLVYPAYPPSINLRKVKPNKKGKGNSPLTAGKDTSAKTCESNKKDENLQKSIKPAKREKLKQSEMLMTTKTLLQHPCRKDGNEDPSKNSSSGNAISSGKSAKRFSATTVCTVEFSPTSGRSGQVEGGRRCEPETPDPSLLVYLHGTKAINVKSPYADRQFSRVKFFQKDGRGMPLIKGLVQKVVSRNSRKVSVKNVSLPDKLSSHRSLDFLNLDENIQMIQNDFLHSQSNRLQQIQESRNYRKNAVKEDQPLERFNHIHNWQQRQHQQPHHQQQQLCRDFISSLSLPLPLPFSFPAPDSPSSHQHHRRGVPKQNPSSSPDAFVNEIFENIQHLQCLPDTKENRKLISKFFDYLDERIENCDGKDLTLENLASFGDLSRSVPILGY